MLLYDYIITIDTIVYKNVVDSSKVFDRNVDKYIVSRITKEFNMQGFNIQYAARVTIKQVSETAVSVNGKVVEFNRPITLGMIKAIVALIG